MTEGSQGRAGVTLGEASSPSLEVSTGQTMLPYITGRGGTSTPLSALSLKESITEVGRPCSGRLGGHLTRRGEGGTDLIHFT